MHHGGRLSLDQPKSEHGGGAIPVATAPNAQARHGIVVLVDAVFESRTRAATPAFAGVLRFGAEPVALRWQWS